MTSIERALEAITSGTDALAWRKTEEEVILATAVERAKQFANVQDAVARLDEKSQTVTIWLQWRDRIQGDMIDEPSVDSARAIKDSIASNVPLQPGWDISVDFVAAIPRKADGSPDWDVIAGREGAAPDPPRTHSERLIAAIWSELLGIESIRVHDDFFELGGHSLLAMEVLGKIRDQTGIELPLELLFSTLTVAELAKALDTASTPALSVGAGS